MLKLSTTSGGIRVHSNIALLDIRSVGLAVLLSGAILWLSAPEWLVSSRVSRPAAVAKVVGGNPERLWPAHRTAHLY